MKKSIESAVTSTIQGRHEGPQEYAKKKLRTFKDGDSNLVALKIKS